MAMVTLPVGEIRKALAILQKRIDLVSSQVPEQGKMSLEIPEPYDHAIQPENKAVCFMFDECGEIGILLGVEGALKRDSRTRRPARGRK